MSPFGEFAAVSGVAAELVAEPGAVAEVVVGAGERVG
jgi:hypothetical protein